MDTQVLNLGPPGASTSHPSRSRKPSALIAVAAVLVIVIALGLYFVAFRSLPTTVTWAPSVSAIAPGAELTLFGRVTPTESGRQVSFESAPSSQGPWQPMPQVATSDSHGRFSITFRPQFTESIVIRVVVDPAGRFLQVIGQSKSVRRLSRSDISLQGKRLVTNQIPFNFTVVVEPPSVGRTVRLEQSSDQAHWVTVGPSAQTRADGTAVVKVPSLAVGVWSYRATVLQDDKFAASMSPVVGVTVEDIKVVAARAAAAHAKAVAELARQAKAKAEVQAAAAARTAIFIGTWNGHGGQLVVRPNGSATLVYRIYVWCSDNPTPPCDQMNGDVIISGGQVALHIAQVVTVNGVSKATAHVNTSSDPNVPPGSNQTFVLDADVVTWSGFPLCGPKAASGSCGA